MSHKSQLLSIDLWGTLLRLTTPFKMNVIRYLESTSPLSSKEIELRMGSLNERLDNVMTKTGLDIPSSEKVSKLLEAAQSTATVEEFNNILRSLLVSNPPENIYPEALDIVEDYCKSNNLRFVISSNSDFLSASHARLVLQQSVYAHSPYFLGSYFSEELLVAKPSLAYFERIESLTNCVIIRHTGDTPATDGMIAHRLNPVIIGSQVQNDAYTSIESFEELLNLGSPLSKSNKNPQP